MLSHPIQYQTDNTGVVTDIVTQAQGCFQADFFESDAPVGRFLGTTNQRELRVIDALLVGPLMREELDSIARASNGPALVQALREKGLELPCNRISRRDFDSRACRPGQYRLSDNDRKLVLAFKSKVQS